jgi:hypothetical protein
MNKHLSDQINEDIIKNGMKFILKEIPIFLNEVISTLIEEMTAGEGYITRVIAVSSNEDESKVFSMSINPLTGKHSRLGIFGIDIYSNITCDAENTTLTIIEHSFKNNESEETISEEKVEDNTN